MGDRPRPVVPQAHRRPHRPRRRAHGARRGRRRRLVRHRHRPRPAARGDDPVLGRQLPIDRPGHADRHRHRAHRGPADGHVRRRAGPRRAGAHRRRRGVPGRRRRTCGRIGGHQPAERPGPPAALLRARRDVGAPPALSTGRVPCPRRAPPRRRRRRLGVQLAGPAARRRRGAPADRSGRRADGRRGVDRRAARHRRGHSGPRRRRRRRSGSARLGLPLPGLSTWVVARPRAGR